MIKIIRLFVILSVMLLAAQTTVWAGEKTTWNDIFSGVVGHYPPDNKPINQYQPKNWEFDFGLQRFIMSHTSYEFGNPDEPKQDHISRLEFPLNTWWLDFNLRRTCPRWSIGGRAGFSVSRNADGPMMDSDWENPENLGMLTTYSESACRAEGNFHFRGDIDVNISDWLRLPPGWQIRPLFAFQYQHFKVAAHDGTQWSVGNYDDEDASGFGLDGETTATALKDDSIRFRQNYYIYQIGLRAVYDGIKIGKYVVIKLHGEADWGPVIGYNEDHHLQRSGYRFTYEKTSGNSLYFITGMDMVIAKTFTAGIKMDYMWIRTTGVHRMSDSFNKTDQTWSDHVNVWSDQMSLIGHVSYAF